MEKETSKTNNKKAEESKALAIVALVLGIIGIIFCWAPFFGLICCLAGVILGIVALVKKQQKGMAIAGLVCGAVGLISSILISIATGAIVSLFGGAINEAQEYLKDPTAYCKAHPDYSDCKSSSTSGSTTAPTPTPSSYKPIVSDIYDYLMQRKTTKQ